jgi:hypothetical protein
MHPGVASASANDCVNVGTAQSVVAKDQEVNDDINIDREHN